MNNTTEWVSPASNAIAEANKIVGTETTRYYIWDVYNERIVNNMMFSTIAEVITYGDRKLIHFWKEHNNLYRIREI